MDNSIVGLTCDNTLEPSRCALSPGAVEGFALDASGTTRVTITDGDGPGPQLGINSILWAAAFSEERLALWSSTVSYVVLLNAGLTISDTMIGGQPTVHIRSGLAEASAQGYQKKFTIAHEYGHVKTAIIPIVMMIGLLDSNVLDYTFGGGPPDHSGFSAEWQSAAAIEGFAEYYSALTWWDNTTPIAQLLAPGPTPSNIKSDTTTEFMRYIDDACIPFNLPECPPGVATDFDWLAALWNFPVTQTSPPDVLRLLGSAFPWPVNGATDAYWVNFTDSIQSILSSNEFDDFLDSAQQGGINR